MRRRRRRRPNDPGPLTSLGPPSAQALGRAASQGALPAMSAPPGAGNATSSGGGGNQTMTGRKLMQGGTTSCFYTGFAGNRFLYNFVRACGGLCHSMFRARCGALRARAGGGRGGACRSLPYAHVFFSSANAKSHPVAGRLPLCAFCCLPACFGCRCLTSISRADTQGGQNTRCCGRGSNFGRCAPSHQRLSNSSTASDKALLVASLRTFSAFAAPFRGRMREGGRADEAMQCSALA